MTGTPAALSDVTSAPPPAPVTSAVNCKPRVVLVSDVVTVNDTVIPDCASLRPLPPPPPPLKLVTLVMLMVELLTPSAEASVLMNALVRVELLLN